MCNLWKQNKNYLHHEAPLIVSAASGNLFAFYPKEHIKIGNIYLKNTLYFFTFKSIFAILKK